MSDLIRLSGTTVSAPDAIALARFYAEITGGVAKADESWALVEGPNGDIGFQQIDDYRPPTWPDGDVQMQGPKSACVYLGAMQRNHSPRPRWPTRVLTPPGQSASDGNCCRISPSAMNSRRTRANRSGSSRCGK